MIALPKAGSALRKIERLHADPALRKVVSSVVPRLTVHAGGDPIRMPKVFNVDALGKLLWKRLAHYSEPLRHCRRP